ncbi:flagellum-associated coiled-coil domain-containing protein 1 isoform X2 [Hyla sarda]|uniref:flagellum-associated coiled-coil domain-containing protein 1 isoform X2 n=2 Tax=Hyla sarda TaxID=327740 RepID=UPI0024C3CA9C|nr:flagellum-associated coiled-coil domain-containing protein 1 isoform X2 [Hyla sarda]XP_056392242.1 flagellum-associated coiled-coil domain-containing protein 1 isoform X2 [Hyla sarda]
MQDFLSIMTSPPAFTTLRDPGRNLSSAKSSSHDKKWICPRMNGTRTKSRGSIETDKYQVISPGYSIKRSKNYIEVRLEDQVFGSVETPDDTELPPKPRYIEQASMQKLNKRDKSLKGRENIVDDLQEQIAKLTALLKQEISEHERTQKRMAQELEKEVKELQTEKEEQIRVLEEKHAAELLSVQQEDSAKLAQEREDAENRYDELHKELSLVKSSFKTYQESLSEEMTEAWLQKETRLKESFEEQKLIDMAKQRQSLMDAFEVEKKEIHKRALDEQAMIQQSYEAQIEETWKKYKEATQETKMLNALKKHLHSEIAEKNKAILSLNTELQHAHLEISTLKSQIDKMEKNFDQSVSKVEARYKNRIQSMMNENADLRRKFIAKSEQLFSQRNKDITRS